MTQTFGIADEIRAAMAKRKISNAQMAEALGKDGTTVSRKLHGGIPITVPELIKIADLLGMSPADLLGESKVAS